MAPGGCSGGSQDPANGQQPDATLQPDTASNHDDGPVWTTRVIGADEGGLYPSLAVSNAGDIGVAYVAASPVEGHECTEVGSDDPPLKMFWTVYFTRGSRDTDWQTERATRVLSLAEPRGLDFGYGADGRPTIALMSGSPVTQPPYCGANDVGLLTRDDSGKWSLQTAVRSSSEAATGQPASDFGEVVGYWPALAFDGSDQPVIAYKDVHAGGLQDNDRTRADLELARHSGRWTARAVDIGRGAGEFNSVAIDSRDRPIVGYYNPVESQSGPQLGVWAARPAADGHSFEHVQLFNQATDDGPSVVVAPDDDLARILFYNSKEGYPQLARQVSAADFESVSSGWELSDIGDARFDEGYGASLAVGPRGKLAAAYYRCARVTDGLGDCAPGDDALIFAWADAGRWTREVVDAGGDGFCGRNPSLSIDATGTAHIAYQCETLVDGTLQPQLKYARRTAL